jgi:hypothetical protein
MPKTSDRIRARLTAAGAQYRANDNIAAFVEPGELDALTEEVAGQVNALLQSLVIDTVNDHNTRETGARVARMYLSELFAGRYAAVPDLTAFPNITSYDELYLSDPSRFARPARITCRTFAATAGSASTRARTFWGCRNSTGLPNGSPRDRRSRKR